MLETLLIVAGTAIALYILLGLLDRGMRLFRQSVVNANVTHDSQKCETTVSDGLTAVSSYGLPSDFDVGIAHHPVHADGVRSEAVETVSSCIEGGQSLLEGATEQLDHLVESVIHAVSEL